MRELRVPKGALVVAAGLLSAPTSMAAEFTYTYQGLPVSLTASPALAAVRDPGGGARSPVALPDGAEPVPGGAELRLGRSRFVLVRARATGPGDTSTITAAESGLLEELLTRGADAQPVFELGGATKFPADEVLVGFSEPLSVEQVRDRLAPQWDALRLRSVRPSRERTFVVTIDQAAGGRAFEASRALASSPGVRFAEPNFVVAYSSGASCPFPPPSAPSHLGLATPLHALSKGAPVPSAAAGVAASGLTSWVVLTGTDFSDGAPGWATSHAEGATAAEPAIVASDWMRSPPHAVHMTAGGPAGVDPGTGHSAPYGCRSYLLSPVFDAAGYEDAFVELWFNPQYDEPRLDPFEALDFGRLLLLDAANGAVLDHLLLASPLQIHTYARWHKALWRIPPRHRRSGIQVAIEFTSDDQGYANGLYIDDIRVLGGRGLSDERPSADPYSSRQHGLVNRGQLAGQGGDENGTAITDAWALGPFARETLIAVLGDGVEREHPDLVVRQGFDAGSGDLSGEPQEAGDRVAQSSAGLVSAIADNGLGIAGTAPGFPVLPVRIGSTDESLASAIDGAVERGARIILHTIAFGESSSQAVEDAQRDALARGVVIVAPAGENLQGETWRMGSSVLCAVPGERKPICVGASSPADELKRVDSCDGQFWWESRGYDEWIDLVAPGTWMVTTDRQGESGYNSDPAESGIETDYTAEFSGTAAAAAHVAGVVALMLDRNQALSPDNVWKIMTSTARDLYDPGRDYWTGYGRLDARAALRTAIDLGDAAGSVSRPDPPVGTGGTKVGASEAFTLSGAICSRGEPVQYKVDWGDGTVPVWLPPGITTATHAWDAPGGYELTCQARCAGHTALVSTPSPSVIVGVRLAHGPNLNGTSVGQVVRECKRSGSGWKCTIKGKMRIRNGGDLPSPAATYDLRLIYPVPIQGVPPVRLGATLPALKPGASKTVKFNEAIAPDAPQAFYLWAILDPMGRVAELDETDNYVRMGIRP